MVQLLGFSEMKQSFCLRAHAEFYADGIDDALDKLAKHFTAIANGGVSEGEEILCGGEIHVHPTNDCPSPDHKRRAK